jgi:hypothetical protein
MADNKSKTQKTTVADFVADSMHGIANHSSSSGAEEIHKQADHARRVGDTKIVNVGTKIVSRPPFEEDGKWYYYEIGSSTGTTTRGPFDTQEEAAKDMLK